MKILHKIGEKLNKGAKAVISVGKKVTGKVASIGHKVLKVGHHAKAFVPEAHKAKVDKLLGAVTKVTNLASDANKALGKAEVARSGLEKAVSSRDLMGGAKIARDAYYDTKTGLKYTREVIGRGPQPGLSTAPATKAAGRAKTSIERQR